MALPRAYSLGRTVVSRGAIRAAGPAFLTGRITVPCRSFISRSPVLRDVAQDDVSGSSGSTPISQASVSEAVRKQNACSVKLLKVPRRVAKGVIEKFFRDAGFDVVKIEMVINRFSFENNTHASVQLANEQQAQQAVQALDKSKDLGGQLVVRAMDPETVWGFARNSQKPYSFLVPEDHAGLRSAVNPIIEGRRVRISVKYPAWGKKDDTPSQRRDSDLKVIERIYSPFGIEAISRSPPQYGQKSFAPKYFCHIDFTTKKGADEAIEATNDTEFEGIPIKARLTQVDPAKAYQIGRIDRALLVELQEQNLAPADSEIDADLVSKKTKKDPMRFDRSRLSENGSESA